MCTDYTVHPKEIKDKWLPRDILNAPEIMKHEEIVNIAKFVYQSTHQDQAPLLLTICLKFYIN